MMLKPFGSVKTYRAIIPNSYTHICHPANISRSSRESMYSSLSLTAADAQSFPCYQFYQACLVNPSFRFYETTWAIETLGWDELYNRLPTTVKSITRSGDEIKAFYAPSANLIYFIWVTTREVTIIAAALTMDEAMGCVNNFKTIFPPIKETTDGIKVKFWYQSSDGATSVTRRLIAPRWEKIATNYPASVRASLDKLIHFRPMENADAGQLLLWSGKPGTGKTYFLRALLQEWKPWLVPHFIIDPENLFGPSSSYLMDVILAERESTKWNLLILEDCGEMLSMDAKERVGQGLSRLLNLVDGFIGQGIRCMILITTNEPVQKLHTAVSRPGRCTTKVEFPAFTHVEGMEWLQSHANLPFHVLERTAGSKERTLAELYGLLNEWDVVESTADRKLGF